MAKLALLCLFAGVSPSLSPEGLSEKKARNRVNATRNLSFPKDCILSCFPCGYGYNQTKKGEKAVDVSLFTVRHVFVEFVEGENLESGIRNPESGMRNSQPFSFCYLWKIISHLQYFLVSLFLKL